MVNLYAEEDGTVEDEPLDKVLSNGSIDVSEDTVVVNVIAAYADQDLTLNAYPAVYQNQNVSGDYTPYAGRIVYNLAAEENGAYVPYTGTAAVDGSGTGTYLAAAVLWT